MVQYHKEFFGKTERVSFSKFPQVLDLPNLLKVQKDSYQWFLDEGLGQILEDISPIEDYNGNLILEFVGYEFDDQTKYSIQEAKYKDTTYSRDLKVKARLINKETEEDIKHTIAKPNLIKSIKRHLYFFKRSIFDIISLTNI